MINITCPECRKDLSIPDNCAGQTGRCNHCGSGIVVPGKASLDSGSAVITQQDPARERKRIFTERSLSAYMIFLVSLLAISVFCYGAVSCWKHPRFVQFRKISAEGKEIMRLTKERDRIIAARPKKPREEKTYAGGARDPMLDYDPHARDPIEYKLAVLNAGGYISKDHITVARFRSLLRQMGSLYLDDEQGLADSVVTVQKSLRAEGIEETLLNIMEGLNQRFTDGVDKNKIDEFAAAYATLRIQGYSHSGALLQMPSFLELVGVH